MNKPNFIKLIIAGLLVVVIVVATTSYGNSQRQKATQSPSSKDSTKSSLPSVQDGKDQVSPADTQKVPEIATPSGGASPAVVIVKAPGQTASTTPRTGPQDNLLPVIVLGLLTGLYLVSVRRAKSQ